MTFNQLATLVRKFLPEGWTIAFSMRQTSVIYNLYDMDGPVSVIPDIEDYPHDIMNSVLWYLNYARKEEGWLPVDLDGRYLFLTN